MDRLPEFFDGSFGALAAAVQEQDAGVAGPAFAFYHRLPTDTADLEVGFPTLRAVTATGDVRAASRCRAARRGGAHRLVRALVRRWERLRGWIDAQGLRAGETFWEVYLTEPTPDIGTGRAADRAELARRGLTAPRADPPWLPGRPATPALRRGVRDSRPGPP